MPSGDSGVPVALFAFRRPEHLTRVLAGLRENRVPRLHVFCDGPRDETDLHAVADVRRLVSSIDWCETEVVRRDRNAGLATSLLRGITQVLSDHESVIVLEDDCIPLPGFYEFVSLALERYRDDPRVGCVSGYGRELDLGEGYPYDGYFTRRISSWGFGTWRRAWRLHGEDWRSVRRTVPRRAVDYSEVGEDLRRYWNPEVSSRVGRDIWTPLWLFPLYLAGMRTLWPRGSYVENCGLDGTGTNCFPTGAGQRLDPVPPHRFRFPLDPEPQAEVTRRFAACFPRAEPVGLIERIQRIAERRPRLLRTWSAARRAVGFGR